MSVFFCSFKNIFKHSYKIRSLAATHKHQAKIFHLVFSVFIFCLPIFVLLPLFFKVCPASSAEMPDKGQHSNFLIVEKSGDFIKARGSGSFEDSEGRQESSFQSKEGFICFLPLHEGQSVRVVPLGQKVSNSEGTKATNNGTSEGGNDRGYISSCGNTHSKPSVWKGIIEMSVLGVLFVIVFFATLFLGDKFFGKRYGDWLNRRFNSLCHNGAEGQRFKRCTRWLYGG